jgi:hypothetical protein
MLDHLVASIRQNGRASAATWTNGDEAPSRFGLFDGSGELARFLRLHRA